MTFGQGEEAHVGQVLERFKLGFEHAVVAGFAGGGHCLAVTYQDIDVGGGFAG